MTTTAGSPIRIDGRIDAEPGRALWLVKWLLLIPHLVVLSLLWLVFVVFTVVALVVILFTGRYPRTLFDFNVGVLRWTWRVGFYGYAALGTDRYPPFSLAERPEYPATLEVAYPERLSRGLVLVKWWLLALPHYVVIGFFVGGNATSWDTPGVRFGGGLLVVLVVIAGVVLAVTGRYPRGIFDFALGINRWLYRVAAYAALMTDRYPPFRLDTGGTDTGGTDTGGANPGGADTGAADPSSSATAPVPGWTTGRTVGVVVGALVLVTGLALTVCGAGLHWFDGTRRDGTGYLTTSGERFTDQGYALRFDSGDLTGVESTVAGRDWLGDVRVRVTADSGARLFVGIARTTDVRAYLSDVPHRRVVDLAGGTRPVVADAAGPPPSDPRERDIWAASESGSGDLTVHWTARSGEWSLVIMNADATPGVAAVVDVGAQVPVLGTIAWVLLAIGLVLLAAGAAAIAIAATRSRRPATAVVTPPQAAGP